MKQALLYVLNVWLTTVLGGPFIHLLIQWFIWFIYHSDEGVGTLQWEYGFLFSLPGLIICLIIIPLFNYVPIILTFKKMVYSIIGAATVVLPLYYLKGGFVNWVIAWSVSYCSVMFAAIWLYKVPGFIQI